MLTLTISQLRKQLKALGFSVKTETLSFGKSGSIVRLCDKQVMPSMFMGEAHRREWIPAIETVRNIKVIDNDGNNVSGPWSSLS